MKFMFGFSEVSHGEYNAFVQRVQTEAAAWRMETRVREDRAGGFSDKPRGSIVRETFEVYWDGKWWPLAREAPFVGPADREADINDDGWVYLQAQMARALVGS